MEFTGGRGLTVVVTPVLNDWAGFEVLAKKIGGLDLESVCILAVDDGSTEPVELPELTAPTCLRELRLMRLNANHGHQRAIALGLAYVHTHMQPARVVVMDSDGEDRPQDVPRLLAAANDKTIAVARREQRTEGAAFKAFYVIYRVLFYLLTGRAISFGNFCTIPGAFLPNIVFHPTLWNNFAATVLRSRVPINFLPTNRGTRYHGRSKMNFTSLVVHGVSAISVFTDVVIGRIMLFLLGMLGAVVIAALVVLAFRFGTDLLIPGYATFVFLFLFNVVLTMGFTGFMLMLTLLSNRDQVSRSPVKLLDEVVRSVEIYHVHSSTPVLSP